MNWAKRRGISYENFQVPKLDILLLKIKLNYWIEIYLGKKIMKK